MHRGRNLLVVPIASAAFVIALAAIQEGGPGLSAFASGSAQWWLYGTPTGSYTDLSSNQQVQSLVVHVSGHDGGYDYPVQYTDGSHGTTTFTDYGWYGRNDSVAVPNIQSGGSGFAQAQARTDI